MKIAPRYDFNVTEENCRAYFEAYLGEVGAGGDEIEIARYKLLRFFPVRYIPADQSLKEAVEGGVTKDDCTSHFSSWLREQVVGLEVGSAWRQLLQHFPVKNLRDRRLLELIQHA